MLADDNLSHKARIPPLGLQSLEPASLFPSIVMGVIIWLVALVFGASFVALIFHGKLAPGYGTGLGIFLVSSIAISLFTALFSSDRSAIPSPQDTTAIIVASMAANLVALAPAEMPYDILYWTVLATISLSATVTGIFFIFCGAMRIANLVRFLPYPVVGGFIAGMGWLLVQGSFSVMVDLEDPHRNPIPDSQLGVAANVVALLNNGSHFGAFAAVQQEYSIVSSGNCCLHAAVRWHRTLLGDI